MPDPLARHPLEWRRLLSIACDLLDQVQAQIHVDDIEWSFGGGTALIIQIGHRESYDIDIFLDDAQLLGFLDPSKSDLRFAAAPSDYVGDGSRFQKFSFENLGEIDFISAPALTARPFKSAPIAGRRVNLETVPEIIAKKIYHRGTDAKPRDIFDIAAAARDHRQEIVSALRAFPQQVTKAIERLHKLNPEFVQATIGQLVILPDYSDMTSHSLEIAKAVLREALPSATTK